MAAEDLITGAMGPGIVAGLMAMGAIFIVFAIILAIAVYIYSSFAMMTTAKRIKTAPAWLAWIPIANLYLMSKMAKMPWWPMLLLIGALIPVIGFLFMIAFLVFYIIWLWKVCETRHKPGWFAVLVVVPFAGPIWALILWGILAWGD